MNGAPSWLPPLVKMEDYNGEWDKYLDALHDYFVQDFVHHKPTFRSKPLSLKRHPLSYGKEATFWHVISSGATEEKRFVDPRRCERIRWIRAVIEHAGDPSVKVWFTNRSGESRICLWLEEQEYLVILAERKGYLLIWTAYTVTENHRKRKLQKEFESYCRLQAPKG